MSDTREVTYPWGDTRRFYGTAQYLRNTLGATLRKIPVDAGMTCPNRDGTVGTSGCTFCNNEAFSPSYCNPEASLTEQIATGRRFVLGTKAEGERFLVYFQSYSNTYAPTERLEAIYNQALGVDNVAGLVIATRPDCISDSTLDLLARLAEKTYVCVEYGIESTSDEVLKAVNRGHDFECARRAVVRTAERGIACGAHFILGLPGQTAEQLVAQTDIINSLPLSTVKFHQLQLFNNTALADLYRLHPEAFSFFSLDEYLSLLCRILQRLSPRIAVERIVSEVPPRYRSSAGSFGGLTGNRIIQMLEAKMRDENIFQGQMYLRTQ